VAKGNSIATIICKKNSNNLSNVQLWIALGIRKIAGASEANGQDYSWAMIAMAPHYRQPTRGGLAQVMFGHRFRWLLSYQPPTPVPEWALKFLPGHNV